MEIEAINDKIITNFNKDQKKAITVMSKTGFVNADGGIYQYDPRTITFDTVEPSTAVSILNNLTGNKWNFITTTELMDILKSELPKLTKNDIELFNNYMEWVNVPIDDKLIKELLDQAIEDNDSLKSDNDFKGKIDLVSQMLILRNHDIFTNGMFLFKLEDGNFIRFDSEDVRLLFEKEMGGTIALQLIKNNFKSYRENLTNIAELFKLINERNNKERILNESQKGYETVMNVVKKFK